VAYRGGQSILLGKKKNLVSPERKRGPIVAWVRRPGGKKKRMPRVGGGKKKIMLVHKEALTMYLRGDKRKLVPSGLTRFDKEGELMLGLVWGGEGERIAN